MSLPLPGGHRNEVGVRNILHVEGAHNSLSQSRITHRGLRIVPVNGYVIKIYNKSLIHCTRGQGLGRGTFVGVARQTERLFWRDVKFAGKRYRARGLQLQA
jgi:hypothetical protein